MSNYKDEEKINALRDRLYARGAGPVSRKKYKLTDRPTEVQKSWQEPPKQTPVTPTPTPKPDPKPTPVVQKAPAPVLEDAPKNETATESMAPKKRARTYRLKILLAAVFFFFFAVAVSSYFFVAGGNSISGDNIVVSVSGPSNIGGGEVMPLQVGVTNQNAVPIESATLIVTYPRGTQSATEEGKEIFVERLSLDTIESGETLNIPVRAIVFGEENEEKTITVEVEYRVKGSNSVFAKAADPLVFKIGSSPVVISVQSLYKVSSGQDNEIELTIKSNSPNTLTGLLVKADYPNGFDYTTSEPSPISGQNVWRIDTLEPEGSAKITIQGIIVGNENDESVIHFSAGVANETDPLNLASIFSTASADFIIEQPFLQVALGINGDSSEVVAVEEGNTIGLDISVNNTLSDTIYDGTVALEISGNALSDYEVNTDSGFYDSVKNTVFWESTSYNALREIAPGKEVRLRVTLVPSPDVASTPQLDFNVSARARRVTEGRVTEELLGTTVGAVKVSSVASLITEVGRNTSTFGDSGPIPPVAEEKTTYTLTLFTQNGSNDMSDVEVTASLPTYVEWLGNTAGAGAVTYNENARTITWDVGDITGNQSKIAAFQVSFLPSISQIGTTPTILGEQRLRGIDRFTGSVVRTKFQALTTRLAEEAGYEAGSGQVQDPKELNN